MRKPAVRKPAEPSTRLRDWRLATGLTLSEVAGLSGFSTAQLSYAERGQRAFSTQGKVKLARALRVPVTTLFGPAKEDTHAA